MWKDDACSLSGDLGGVCMVHWLPVSRTPHPFKQDPDNGRLTRPPPAVCPPSISGWTTLATLVPAAQICIRAAVSSQERGPVSNTLFPV